MSAASDHTAPADPPQGDLVFVYGTLRRGFVNNPATIAFRTGATFVAEGRLPGGLYAVGWYPALIEGEAGEVVGELWRLTSPGLMEVLDDYEGLFDPGPPEYAREKRQVTTADGPMEAWVYVYLQKVDPAQRIEAGDWAAAFNDPRSRRT